MLLDAEHLRYLRAKNVLSLRELSALSGVSHDAISLFEREERYPRPSTIRKLAQALAVEPAELILWESTDEDTGEEAD